MMRTLQAVLALMAMAFPDVASAVPRRPASAATRGVASVRKQHVVTSIKNVRSVYVKSLKGDRVFARRLMAEMRDMGLQFVNQ